jgi:hypothetical protein
MDQGVGHEFGVAGGGAEVVEAFAQLLGSKGFEAQAAADAAGDGQQVAAIQAMGETVNTGLVISSTGSASQAPRTEKRPKKWGQERMALT